MQDSTVPEKVVDSSGVYRGHKRIALGLGRLGMCGKDVKGGRGS